MLTISRLLAILILGTLAACVPDPGQDIAGFSGEPGVNTGNSADHSGCEVKGSGAYDPCLLGSAPVGQQSAAAPGYDPARFNPTQCLTGFGGGIGGFLAHAGEIEQWQAYCNDIENGAHPKASTPAAAAPVAAGAGQCANPFGGPPAAAGQFICDSHGEPLACLCSGGNCRLDTPKGVGLVCTRAGAVIN